MVMRNKHGGDNPPGGPDDLPAWVRSRFGTVPLPDAPPQQSAADPQPPFRSRWGQDVGRLVVAFLVVAVVNLVVLLLALAFLRGGPGLPSFAH